MFSGLQALEGLGTYSEGNQRTAIFLFNRGAMDLVIININLVIITDLLRQMEQMRILL